MDIAPEHHRKDYASEAIHIVLKHSFEELNYQKVAAGVASWNHASLRLHEKPGFQKRRCPVSNGIHAR